MRLGEVYKLSTDNSICRIIGFDRYEVFYDAKAYDGTWIFSGNFNKKCYFYRTAPFVFRDKAVLIGSIPLNDNELTAFRPDLLLRTCRTNMLSWNDFKFSSFIEFKEYYEKKISEQILDERIEAPEIVLLPFGPKGGIKKGTKLVADNKGHFNSLELIWKAKEIQEAVNDEKSNGIGIYRIGFESKVPSYYIGEYIDKANLLSD